MRGEVKKEAREEAETWGGRRRGIARRERR